LFGRAFPYPRYLQFRDRNEVFSGILAACALDQVTLGVTEGQTPSSGIIPEQVSGRLVSSLLYGLKATDTWTIAGATLFMLVVAGMAGYIPARKASHVDPLLALRHE